MRVRPPAVAGTFYPGSPEALASQVHRLLAGAAAPPDDEAPPHALVVPHAGYRYSGPVAASAYVRAARLRGRVTRVVLAGPAHWQDVAVPTVPAYDAYAIPGATVPIDETLRERALDAGAGLDDAPHAPEHSLEVQLPFVVGTLGPVPVLPVLVGVRNPAAEVADLLDATAVGPDGRPDPATLVLLSTDLSHYEPHASAQEHDRRTVASVLALDAAAIRSGDACGAAALRGLLVWARRHGLTPRLLDRRTSADTAGGPERTVGYCAVAFS